MKIGCVAHVNGPNVLDEIVTAATLEYSLDPAPALLLKRLLMATWNGDVCCIEAPSRETMAATKTLIMRGLLTKLSDSVAIVSWYDLSQIPIEYVVFHAKAKTIAISTKNAENAIRIASQQDALYGPTNPYYHGPSGMFLPMLIDSGRGSVLH